MTQDTSKYRHLTRTKLVGCIPGWFQKGICDHQFTNHAVAIHRTGGTREQAKPAKGRNQEVESKLVQLPEGDMTMSRSASGAAGSLTLMVMLPPVPVTHPML